MPKLTLKNIKRLFKEEFEIGFENAFKPAFENAFTPSFESGIKAVKEELSGLKNNIGTLNDKFERYIKKESDGIEYEINKNVKHFLQQKYKGAIIKQLPIKNLKNYSDSEDTDLKIFASSTITEFDGFFIIDYKSENKKNELIIVEAKHNVSIDQINEKIYQLYFIKKILEKSKLDIITDNKFKNFVNSFKLKNIDNKFHFIIGGPTWEDKTIEYLQKINTGVPDKINWKKEGKNLKKRNEKEILNHIKGHIGIIAPNGTRYDLYDNINYIGELLDSDDKLYCGHQLHKRLDERSQLLNKQKPLKKIEEDRENGLIYGGGNIYKGFEMKILPNYLHP